MHENVEPARPHGHSDCAPVSSDAICRYLPLVYTAARRQVGDSHAAEDVTQGVFLLPEDAAGQRVTRGLAKLRRILMRQGVAPSAAVLGTLLGAQAVQAGRGYGGEDTGT